MAELTLSAGDIAAALKKNLEGFEPSLEARTVGRITEVGDGIARVSGLPDCGVNELLEFEDGSVGLALNLDEESIGAVILGDADGVEEGQTVKATGRILSVPVGDAMLGRVINALGEPIDGRGEIVGGIERRVRRAGHDDGRGRRRAHQDRHVARMRDDRAGDLFQGLRVPPLEHRDRRTIRRPSDGGRSSLGATASTLSVP